MKRLRELWPSEPWDLLALAGVALLTLGGGLAWPPLAAIVPGAACLALGLWGAKLSAYRRRVETDEEAAAAEDA